MTINQFIYSRVYSKMHVKPKVASQLLKTTDKKPKQA
jgi:hypothetical protein